MNGEWRETTIDLSNQRHKPFGFISILKRKQAMLLLHSSDNIETSFKTMYLLDPKIRDKGQQKKNDAREPSVIVTFLFE